MGLEDSLPGLILDGVCNGMTLWPSESQTPADAERPTAFVLPFFPSLGQVWGGEIGKAGEVFGCQLLKRGAEPSHVK